MKKIMPFTLMLLTSLLSYAYQVQITGLVAGPGGNGIPEAQVLIYSSLNDGFAYENKVVTNSDGIFEDLIDVPEDIERGVLFVALIDCATTQVKRIVFSQRQSEHKVRLNACRDETRDCHVEIKAERFDDGQIALKAVTHGDGPFTFKWTTEETTQEIIVSDPGEYCVEISNDGGCTARDCIDLRDIECGVEIQVARLDANSSVAGFVVLHARAKGHAPFKYEWSTGETTKSIKVEIPGDYCVSIIDALGCEARACIKIDPRDDCKTEIQILSTDLANVGPVVLVAETKGQEPFSYLWSNGETTERITVEHGGQHCVRVTDATGCVSGDCVNLDRRDCSVKIQAKRSHPHADSTHIILTARAKGREPIAYLWSTGETSGHIRITEMGEYCVTITDASGCEARDCIKVEVRDDCATEIQVAHQTNDLTGGFALVARTKGTAPFSFLWSTGETTQTILPGDETKYCVDVIDATGCSSSDCIDLSNLRDSCSVEIKGNPNGVLVAVTRGTPQVKYLWSTGATTKHIQIQEPGEYCVTITNVFGCTATACINVAEIIDSLCRVKIFRKRTNDKKVELTAKVIGVGDFEFLWSTGETSTSIVVDSSGEYCVTAFNANCKDEDCVKVNFGNSGVQIGDIHGFAGEKIGTIKGKASPNPFKGKIDLDLQTESTGMADIHILRLDGKMVYQASTMLHQGSNRVDLDLDQLQAGMYFIRILQDTGFETIRIMKSE